MKPILFNTEMVKAIIDGRKTQTRRVIKPKYSNTHFMFRKSKYGTEFVEMQNDVEGETFGKNPDGGTWHKLLGYIRPKPRYQPGEILYVRETWGDYEGLTPYFIYRADYPEGAKTYMYDGISVCDLPKWHPSIHMPTEAARIFLKVTGVRAEKLQEMLPEDAAREGIRGASWLSKFADLWDKTLKKEDLPKYRWNANPWVWVYEFERCEKPGGEIDV